MRPNHRVEAAAAQPRTRLRETLCTQSWMSSISYATVLPSYFGALS